MDGNGLELLETNSNDFQALATSHFFFGDNDYTPVAHLNKRGILFLSTDAGRIAEKKRDERIATMHALHQSKPGDEKRLELDIEERLRADGIKVERQKHCAYGIMDIFIHDNPPRIIELKADSSQASIRQAIGQLAFYSSEYPSAELFIGTPRGLDVNTRNVIAKWGIKEWK